MKCEFKAFLPLRDSRSRKLNLKFFLLSCADGAQEASAARPLVNRLPLRWGGATKIFVENFSHSDSLAQSKAIVASPACASMLLVLDKISHLLHPALRAQAPDFPHPTSALVKSKMYDITRGWRSFLVGGGVPDAPHLRN